VANYFGFFFRRALEGVMVFCFLTGFTGLFFTTAFFFGRIGFPGGFF
jgi:hypothetical protein